MSEAADHDSFTEFHEIPDGEIAPAPPAVGAVLSTVTAKLPLADQLPALPLYYPVYNYAVDEQVQGISVGPLFSTNDRLTNITTWYLVTERTSTESE